MKKYRGFLEDLFCKNVKFQRRVFIQQWHSSYPIDTKNRHKRPADVFKDFIVSILYEKTRLVLKHDRLCFFGLGADHLAVRMSWIASFPKLKAFVIDELFGRRVEIFSDVQFYLNNAFKLEGFVYDSDPNLFLDVYRRELVRDFIWLLPLTCLSEAITAIQKTCLEYPDDVFLKQLHWGLQGQTKITEVLCWNNTEEDLHPYEKNAKRT